MTGGPVLVKGVLLYGEGDPVDVLVSEGQIAEIGTAVPAPDGAEVVDAPGGFCCPVWSICIRTSGSRVANTPRTSKRVRPQRRWAAIPRCSRWPTPTRSPIAR